MTGHTPVSIRPASTTDSDRIAPLLAELGYPTSGDEIGVRLERLLRMPGVGVLVAEVGGEVVGLATFQMLELIYRSRPQCRITALVVGPERRRRGTGSALVDAIERAARERGCFRLELTTRPGREDALSFYTALGFTERPSRLVKFLADE